MVTEISVEEETKRIEEELKAEGLIVEQKDPGICQWCCEKRTTRCRRYKVFTENLDTIWSCKSCIWLIQCCDEAISNDDS